MVNKSLINILFLHLNRTSCEQLPGDQVKCSNDPIALVLKAHVDNQFAAFGCVFYVSGCTREE